MPRSNVIRLLSAVPVMALVLGIVPTPPVVSAAEESSQIQETPSSQFSQVSRLDEEAVPEIVGQDEAERRGHVRRRQDEEGENLNTLIFENADGSRTMYLYDHPVKYRDESGKIRDITLNISDTGKRDAPFRSESAGAVTSFASDLSGGITLTGGQTQLRLVPQNGSGKKARRVDEKTISYPYGTNTSIEYSLTYTGFKEDIVVEKYTGQTEYVFTLHTYGLTLTTIDGSIYLVNETGEVQATVGDIIIFTADERNNAFGELRAETVIPNEEYKLTIVLDPEYLVDPKTAYPIRIDPTIEINYEDSGEGAIEDLTIASSVTYSGSYGALYVGRTQNSGICRILMRFPGLNTADMEGCTVTSATVELRDLMCETTSLNVSCYPYTGSDWTSSSTWASLTQPETYGTALSSQTIDYDIGVTFDTKHWYSFDISDAVQAWFDTTLDPNDGIIFQADSATESGDTVNYRSFASYNRASNKPSLRVEYVICPENLQTENGANYVSEGDEILLLWPNVEEPITWTSSDTNIATVDSSGKVTGEHAGQVTITAQAEGYISKSISLYVTVPDGLYYIKNINSHYYLNVESGQIANYTNVQQYSKYATSASEIYRIRQMWKISYLGNGRYSVRPMHKLDMGLHVTGSNVDIYNIGTTDTLSSLASAGEWTIQWYSTGYVFKNNGSNSLTMQVEGAATSSGATIIASTYSTSINCRWELTQMTESLVGLYLYDTANKCPVTSPTKYVAPNESRTLFNMSLVCIAYSPWTINQTVSWSTSSEATVNSTGTVTGVSPTNGDTITVTAKKVVNGYSRTVSYKLVVTEIPNGTYSIKNKETARYVDIEGPTMAAGTLIHQYAFHGGSSQRWIFSHLGDGTYSIRSAYHSSYYMGVKDNSTDNDAAVVLCSGSITNGMKWKVIKSNHNAYKIIPKTGEVNNRVLAVGWYVLNTDGIDIEQCDFTDDANYKDEWQIVTAIDIGMSTDNYTDGCGYGERQSYRYAYKFYDELTDDPGEIAFDFVHHYNMDSNRTASKIDFATSGAISSDIDFMIYIGHGLKASDSKGNYLHYNCASNGNHHSSDCTNEAYNAYTSEMDFGSSDADLRWVWLYTCNFLTTNSFVTEDAFKEMMTGAHIVMGYASRATLCDAMAEKFAIYLREGEPIIHAYFMAGHYGEASVEEATHYQRVLYIPQASNETIYTPKFDYEYDASDVLIITRDIHSDFG